MEEYFKRGIIEAWNISYNGKFIIFKSFDAKNKQ